jgi:hypothetical protein
MEDVVIFDPHMIYVIAICYILIVVIWYIFPNFGMLHQGQSGNPGLGGGEREGVKE